MSTTIKAKILHRTVSRVEDLQSGVLALDLYQWGFAKDDGALVARDGLGAYHVFWDADAIESFIEDYGRVKEPVGSFALLPVGTVGDLCMTTDTHTYYKRTALGWEPIQGSVIENINNLTFNLSPTGTPVGAGDLRWNDLDQTLDLTLPGDSVLQLGQENHVRALNNTGSTLSEGTVVYLSGSQGQRVTIAKADAATVTGSETIGILTQDVANNATTYVTTFGLVRGADTAGMTEGAPIYLGTTAGTYAQTPPAKPAYQVRLGYVTRAHATQGTIFVSIQCACKLAELSDVAATSVSAGDVLQADGAGLWTPFNLQRVYDDTDDPTGWVDNDFVSTSYDPSTRVVTLTLDPALAKPLSYRWRGRLVTLAGATQAFPAHPATAGMHYLFSSDGATFAWSTTPWAFDDIMVFGVRWWSSAKALPIVETHGLMPWSAHRTAHLGIGTIRNVTTPQGGTVTDFVIGSTLSADRKFGASAVELLDEDLVTAVSALAGGGPYSHLFLATPTTVDVSYDETEVVRMSGSAVQYQDAATASWQGATVGRFLNLWVIATPAPQGAVSQKSRWLIGQPQAQHGSLTLAQGETFASYAKGDLLGALAEFLLVAKVTIKRSATAYSVEAVEQIYGGRSTQAGVPGTAATTAAAVSFVPTGGIASTDVQAALAELDAEKASAADAMAFLTATCVGDGVTDALWGRVLVISGMDPAANRGTIAMRWEQDLSSFDCGGFVSIELGGSDASPSASIRQWGLLDRAIFQIRRVGTAWELWALPASKTARLSMTVIHLARRTTTGWAFSDATATTSDPGALYATAFYDLSVADAVSLIGNANSYLHFHETDRNRANHTGTQAWSTISSTPTSVSGYGITDAITTGATTQSRSGQIVFTKEGDGAASAILVQSNLPSLGINELDAGANEKRWDVRAGGGELFIRALDEASSAASNAISIQRSAATVTGVRVHPTLTTANVTMSGSITSYTAEHKFSRYTYTDPDTGVARAVKIGGSGMAVLGGIKTDSLTCTGAISEGGTSLVSKYAPLSHTHSYGSLTSIPAAIDAIDGLTPAADRLAYYTGASSASLAALTSYARTFIAQSDAAGARAHLGLLNPGQWDAYVYGGNSSPNLWGRFLVITDGSSTTRGTMTLAWAIDNAAYEHGTLMLTLGGSTSSPYLALKQHGATDATLFKAVRVGSTWEVWAKITTQYFRMHLTVLQARALSSETWALESSTATSAEPSAATEGTMTVHRVVTQSVYAALTGGADTTLHYHASDRSRANHTGTQAWSTISSTPTTLSGYGITDAINTSSTAQTKAGDLTTQGYFYGQGRFSSITTGQAGARVHWGADGFLDADSSLNSAIKVAGRNGSMAVQAISETFPVISSTRIASSTNAASVALELETRLTSTQMADGFGTGIYFYTRDADNTKQLHGRIQTSRVGADTLGALDLYGSSGGAVRIYAGGVSADSASLGSTAVLRQLTANTNYFAIYGANVTAGASNYVFHCKNDSSDVVLNTTDNIGFRVVASSIGVISSSGLTMATGKVVDSTSFIADGELAISSASATTPTASYSRYVASSNPTILAGSMAAGSVIFVINGTTSSQTLYFVDRGGTNTSMALAGRRCQMLIKDGSGWTPHQ